MMGSATDLANGLAPEDDLMLAEAPAFPYDWVREGASFWLNNNDGAFAIPRIGIEAEPHTWENRRYNANLAFPDGRVLLAHGLGEMLPVIGRDGRPSVMGAGPLKFECIEPFRKWHIAFDGEAIDTNLDNMMGGNIDPARKVPLQYMAELEMAVPADIQNITPEAFAKLGKGEQRDAVSVGLGLRFTQLFTATGQMSVGGEQYDIAATGNRVKRRSVRTDGLMLRGHCWQGALFPDGRGFGFEVRPVHPEGYEPRNEGFVFLDGKMHHARVSKVKWFDEIITSGEDVSFLLESELGEHHIQGKTAISTIRVARSDLWGLNLHQGTALYKWDGQEALGMIERSNVTAA